MSMTPWNLPYGQWSKNLTLATDTLAGICPVVNGQNVHFEFNFVVKFQVDHFDHRTFGFWPWSWSKFLTI